MSRPLSVVMVAFPTLGGSSVVATQLALGLAERGHTVHFVSRSRPARLPADSERLHFHPVELADYPLFEHPPYTVALASLLTDLIRQHRPDVLHVHYAVPHAASAYLARQAVGGPSPKIVTSLHGTDVLKVGSHPVYRTLTTFTVSQSDGVVVPSAFLEQQAHRLLELLPHVPVEIIPNFVDTEHFSPADAPDRRRLLRLFDDKDASDGPVLFHVSNFRPVKRVTDVVEVLARVRRKMPARLLLIGDGPERAAVEERARDLCVDRWVRFLGKRTDFFEYLKHADAFVLPSEMESFGVAALEALSAGVPVFGYAVGGLPELVTPEVGRLVEPFDVDALGIAVREVLGNPASHLALRKAARARAVEHFQSGPALDRYEDYLRRVLERPRRAEVA